MCYTLQLDPCHQQLEGYCALSCADYVYARATCKRSSSNTKTNRFSRVVTLGGAYVRCFSGAGGTHMLQ